MHPMLIPKIISQNIKNKFSQINLYQKNLSLFQTAGTFPLPDFSDVKLPDGTCSCMTPQGICTTEKYIIITAYCNIKRFQKELAKSQNADLPKTIKLLKNPHMRKNKILPEKQISKEAYEHLQKEPAHSSCLMVFCKKSHAYLGLLELPDKNHVGGITYDGTYLWIAKSTDNCLSVIKETDLNHLVSRKLKHPDGTQHKNIRHDIPLQTTNLQEPPLQRNNIPAAKIDYFQKTVPCGMTASFVTFFEKRIWVGYCAPAGKKGFLRSFQIQKNPHEKKAPLSLIFDRELPLPAKANGASFEKTASGIYLFVSISGGRKKASKMLIYTLSSTAGTAADKNHGLSLHLQNAILLPPLLEESCISGTILYTLYESSSPAYRDVPGNRCPFPVDVVSMAEITAGMQSSPLPPYAPKKALQVSDQNGNRHLPQ